MVFEFNPNGGETDPLGTGGAIAFAIQQMDVQRPFVVMNEDTWLSQSLGKLQLHLPPTIGLVHVEDISRAMVEVDWQDDLVKSFQGETSQSQPRLDQCWGLSPFP